MSFVGLNLASHKPLVENETDTIACQKNNKQTREPHEKS